MPRLRNFTIDEDYLTDVTIVKEGNSYTDNGREPTPEELLKLLKGRGSWRIVGHEDHPEFTKLRDELERLGYIQTERSWSNGDRVIKAFKLNGLILSRGEQFSCATAMGCHLRFKQSHPEYDDGIHW